ncbi:MAG: DUF3263 domain-containing protein [Cellulomonas sp.]|nr:DUF3263 domain-containing protein [Cellulomonas sp.]MCR6649776.1 DUF3263 domain-containing protein [Cellulomonas sp.]
MREILDFEARTWKHYDVKEERIRAELGLTPTAYYQLLNVLLDDPDAYAYAPATVARLRRLRERRGAR